MMWKWLSKSGKRVSCVVSGISGASPADVSMDQPCIGFQNRPVGRGPVEGVQLLRRQPGDGGMLVQGDGVCFKAADKRVERDRKAVVGMGMPRQRLANGDGGAQLLHQFAPQTVFGRFVDFQL